MNEQWTFGRTLLYSNFWLSWIGIFVLLIKVFMGHGMTQGAPTDPNIASMFSALALNLSATVGIVVGGKATEHLVNTRWGADGSGESSTLAENVGGKT